MTVDRFEIDELIDMALDAMDDALCAIHRLEHLTTAQAEVRNAIAHLDSAEEYLESI